MNRIVREHYPVSDLPDDLRKEFKQGDYVTVTLDIEPAALTDKTTPFSLDALFARARPSFERLEEVAGHVESLREEWD